MMRTSYLILLTLALFSFFVITGPVLAQEPNYARINEIAKDLNCPTCAGINLADCRTLTCEQWREKISELVDDGYSDDQVLEYFSARYGTQVLQEPPRRGFSLALWILPVLALLAGGVWLFYTMRSWSQPEEMVPEAAAPLANGAGQPDDDYLNQVEKDLDLGTDD